MPPSSLCPAPFVSPAKPTRFSKKSSPALLGLFATSLLACLFTIAFAAFAQNGKVVRMKPEVMPYADTPVTVIDDGTNFILSNGYLTASINKNTGDMVSLKVHGLETQGYVSGHHAGYWEQSPSGAARLEAKVTIDPAATGGERGEVSVKGWSDGDGLTAHPRQDAAAAIEDAASQLAGRTAGPPAGSGRMAMGSKVRTRATSSPT